MDEEVTQDTAVEDVELPTKAILKQMEELYPKGEWKQRQLNAHLLLRISAAEEHMRVLTTIVQNLRITSGPEKPQPQTFG
mgnify:CR=1 FL=1